MYLIRMSNVALNGLKSLFIVAAITATAALL